MAARTPMEQRRGAAPRRSPALLSWRLYRLCIAPVVVALLIAAFSLSSPPAPLTASLAPEAFEGARAYAQLRRMEALAPSRLPGEAGDVRLLEYLRGQLSELGSASSGGYALRVLRQSAATAWGQRDAPLLIGRRAGSSSAAPIVLIAPRDSASRGDQAQLSGTAALLEIATVLAQTETRHPVYVVFSDGASGGAAGSAQWLHSALGGRVDAAIVLGDLGGHALRRPLVQPFSTAAGGAPEALTSTVAGALRNELGADPGTPSLASQLAHLAFPLSVGEQGPLNGAGIPSVTVSLAGEHSPTAGEPVGESRLQATGRAVLSAFYALDHGPEIAKAPSTSLLLSGRLLPAWTLALLSLSLLIGPLALACDALVRLARRGRSLGRWALLSLSCAWPFLLCAATLKAFAAVGVLHAPPDPVPAAALRLDAGAVVTMLLAAAALALAWRMWRQLGPGADLRRARRSEAAGVVTFAGGCSLGLLVWLLNPYAALLLVPALHAWPLALCPRNRPEDRLSRLALVLMPALAPLLLLAAFYALALGLNPLQMLQEAIAIVGGGYVGWGGTLLWSLGAGLLVAIAIAVLGEEREPDGGLRARRLTRQPALHAGARPVYRERARSAPDVRALR